MIFKQSHTIFISPNRATTMGIFFAIFFWQRTGNEKSDGLTMIDYVKIQKEITQQKWGRIRNKQDDEFTCYYSPGEGHSLCTHPDHCILNKDFQKLHGEIQSLKKEDKKLKNIYENALELKKENPSKNYDELYVGFTPKSNRIKRSILRKNIRKRYGELRTLKTRKGGF